MILVTGSTGYVGRRIVRTLAEKGHHVRCLARPASDRSVFEGLDVEMAVGEVTEPASLRSACEGVDAVVHLVAIIREKGRYTFESVNHLGTRNVVEAAREAGVKRFFHMSAIGARDGHRYPYLRSKWLGEQEAVNSGLAYTILRPSIIFGRGDEFINALAAVVKASPITPIIGSGKTRFQPIAVEDVAQCVSIALQSDAYTGKTTEVGGPAIYTYEELVDIIIKCYGVRRAKVHLPLFLIRWLMPLVRLALPHPPITRAELDMINLDNVAGVDSVERSFGFRPRSLEDNVGYVSGMGRREALAIALGLRPARRW